MTTPEGKLKAALIKEAIARGFIVLAVNQGRKGGRNLPARWFTAYVEHGKQQTSGVTDLILFRAGKVWALDPKSKDGKPRESQLLFMREMERQGFETGFITTIDELPQ